MTPTPRRRAPMTSEQRAAQVADLTDRLNTAVTELAESARWEAMLHASARFHRYSFRNMVLLAMQAEERGMDLTAVAGFTTWKQLGRSVRKGERGFAILAPVTRRPDEPSAASIDAAADAAADAGGRVMVGVRVVHVFDIAQTDGAPLLEPQPRLTGADTTQLWASLTTLVEQAGYTIARNPGSDELGDGYTNATQRIVSVRPDLDPAHATAVLAHELGHIRADHATRRDIPRAQREIEAESIAHIILGAHGLDSTTSAVPYLASWSQNNPDLIAAAAETVHTTAAAILTDLAALHPDTTPAPTLAPQPARIRAAASTQPATPRPSGPAPSP